MPTVAVLRLLVAAELSLLIGGEVIAAFGVTELPALLRQYEEAEGSASPTRGELTLAASGVVLLLVSACASIGIYFLRPWARPMYVATTVGSHLVAPFFGPFVSVGWSNALDGLAAVLSGLVIASVHWTSLAEHFKKRSPSSPRGSSVHSLLILTIASLGLFYCTDSYSKALIRGSVGKVGKKLGKEINKGAIAVGKGAEDVGQEIGKIGDRVGSEFEKSICSIFTGGRSETGEAGCSVSGGAGVDDKGPYTYNPAEPDVKYRGNEQGTSAETTRMIQDAAYLQNTQIQSWEYEDDDILGIRRFLPPDTVIGEAWPGADQDLMPPTASGSIRACGGSGCGDFLSPRSSTKGPSVRFHAGVDYVSTPGEVVYAPMSGYVERLKNPGRPGLEGVLVRNTAGYAASVYYVKVNADIKTALASGVGPDGVSKYYKVEAGKTPIGVAQDLQPAYPPSVPDHIHTTLTDPSGNPVAPDGKTRIRRTPKIQ